MAKGSFPRPHQNDTKVDNSIMEYVPFDNGDVGNRKSNVVNGIKDSAMNLSHVENRKGS
jgi:hypothetical protein